MVPNQLRQKGDAYQKQGEFAKAIGCYQQALQQQPEFAEVYNNMGVAYKNQHQPNDAIRCYQIALKLKPNYASAYNNLANMLRNRGLFQEACQLYRKALKLKPDMAEVCNNIANCLRELGHIDEAISYYQKAIELRNGYAEAYNNLGYALQCQDKFNEAIRCHSLAVKLTPDNPHPYTNLGIALQKQGRLTAALDCFQKAIDLNPDDSRCWNNLGNLCIFQGRIPAALEAYGRALRLRPDDSMSISNLLLAMHYDETCDPSRVFETASEWWRARGIDRKDPRTYGNSTVVQRRLKIGLVSPDFRKHSVSYFLLPFINGHDPHSVEITCYSQTRCHDQVSALIRESCALWRSTAGISDRALAEQIRRDRIDILIDLAGHTSGNRLGVFARKPAPIQITWIGFPNTTGLPTMDYRITDEEADPPGSGQYHSEALLRLRGGFLCYDPPPVASELTPMRQSGEEPFTFGSFNNLPKINKGVIALWSRVLKEVPGSRLLMKCKSFADRDTRNRYRELFQSQGVAGDRLTLMPAIPSTREHLKLYGRVDIALDPFPYNGTATTCEALWMGVPVLTLRGDRHCGRVGASLLTRIGLSSFVADNPEQYVNTAKLLADDRDELAKLRKTLRHKMAASPLCDAGAFSRNLEEMLRTIWSTWCQGQQQKDTSAD